MEFIDIDKLRKEIEAIRKDYHSKKPFKYTAFEGLFKPEMVDVIYNSYPSIEHGAWDGTTYIDQKNKFQKTVFESGSLFDKVFKELNSAEFLNCLEEITQIKSLIGDEELFGGGLHQSIKGAFLNVHVDYNIHPKTNYHRRLNVITYMNKDWKDEYEGHLELWDLNNGNKKMLERIAPTFNKCVIFETNEISYHGHPKQLNAPPNVNRKSLATYYYTESRPEVEMATEHNTVYVNTEGVKGLTKRFIAGTKAFFERIK